MAKYFDNFIFDENVILICFWLLINSLKISTIRRKTFHFVQIFFLMRGQSFYSLYDAVELMSGTKTETVNTASSSKHCM